MSGHNALAVSLALGLAAAMPGAARAESLLVLDIEHATTHEVEALKQLPRDAWWLEMGDQLVLVGADSPGSTAPRRVLAHWPDIDPARLWLRGRGCSEHAIEAGRLLARGGRWELRDLDPVDAARIRASGSLGWRPVAPDRVIARRFRDADALARAPLDPQVAQVVARIDAARWFDDVETLADWDRSSYGTTSLEAARDWIASRFESLGLQVTVPGFPMPGPSGGTITRHNVIGTWTGSVQPDRWVVVGAHYDARNLFNTLVTGTPGAEDNATGCAGVIELARALLPSRPARSIAFVCYSGEEQGLHGSAAHVQALDAAGDLGEVDLVVIMDMIGYSADADLEALFESEAEHADFLQSFATMAALHAPELAVVTSLEPFGSDHMPYLGAGLRTALAIENDWDIYPHYHRSTDVPANLGPHALAMGAAILKTNAAVIADLGGIAPPVFGDGFEDAP